MNNLNRRAFLRTSLFGGIAAAAAPSLLMQSAFASQAKMEDIKELERTQVSLVTGTDRADMAFRALQPFSKEIAQAVGKKRIILKPNFVSSSIQLSATHSETMEGILEFYKSIKKLENVIIAESPADGPAIIAYDNYKFIPVAEKYKVKLMDIDETPIKLIYLIDEKDFMPKPLRVASMFLDHQDNFVMSVARMKTHDRIIATLSLKNIVVGAPVKDIGYISGKNRPAGTKNDKPIVHGSGIRGINYNLFTCAPNLRPDLAFIDGYDGMEGNGPTRGTAVDSRVCVAGLDWLAVDRIGVELMGIDPANMGYLTYCAGAGMGEYDINKINVIGEKVADHIKPYRMPDSIERQLEWKRPMNEAAAQPQQRPANG
ncbi:MAG: DUF362 domain-containing protein [Tannerella sp.]|jgi:uncharacterized protein (DUF362 family)|nr:DUF362 domain-containing protein [Tannerella sp.]